ncbi:MAG: PKD domain-containing protein, partial [Gammaproteobacteria bacterium]|nr:PKD domain-containing protein [Gammaproteobacteria bacterium]
DGTRIVSGSSDDTLKVWDAGSGAELLTLSGHTASVYAAAFSPDGTRIVSGSDNNTLKVWDAGSGAELLTLSGHTNYVMAAAFSPDGTRIYSGSWDRTIKVWDSGLAPPKPPTAKFSLTPESGIAPLTVTLDASQSSDPDGEIVAYSWLWNGQTFSTAKLLTIPDAPAGEYFLTLRVTDNAGATDEISRTMVIHPNLPPNCGAIEVSPASGNAPLSTAFRVTCTDPESGALHYSWNLGDGNSSDQPQFSHLYENPGEYAVTAEVRDEAGNTVTPSGVTVTVPPPVPGSGQAIILTGVKKGIHDTLFRFSNERAHDMYRLLLGTGYEHDDIHYLNLYPPDLDEDGHRETERHDYDLFEPENHLRAAFGNASARLAAGDLFVLYFHGHADKEELAVTSQYVLSASALRDLLAGLPAGTRQLVILDACFSGSFLDDLAAPNRIVISSTDAERYAWTPHWGNGFSDEFMDGLRRGNTVQEAFQAAERLLAMSASADPRLLQQPWLDDDGDGIYSTRDGSSAAQITLLPPDMEPQPGVPVINEYRLREELPPNMTKVTLWLETPGEQVRRARAALLPPGFEGVEYAGENTVLAREELDLIFNAAQSRYEIAYDGFHLSGTWRVLYQVQNSEGIWSDTAQSEVVARVSCSPCVDVQVNQGSYTIGDRLFVKLLLAGSVTTDIYAALVFPDGDFITIAYPLNFSWPGVIQPYQSAVEIAGSRTVVIMDFPLPSGPAKGAYQMYGVLVRPGADPGDGGNWLHFDAAEFKIE